MTGRFGAVVLGLVLLLGMAGCDRSASPQPSDPSSSATAGPSSTAGPSTPASPSATRGPSGPAPLPKAANTSVSSVSVGSIGLHTTKLEKLAVAANGQLAAPKDPQRAGWFSGGTLPGEIGPAVIAGHIDSKTGPAVFFELRSIERGDVIKIGLSNGKSVDFVVDRVITTAKSGFPTDEVFGPTPDAELRLITCGGPYDRTLGGYLDNTIVFATQVERGRPNIT